MDSDLEEKAQQSLDTIWNLYKTIPELHYGYSAPYSQNFKHN